MNTNTDKNASGKPARQTPTANSPEHAPTPATPSATASADIEEIKGQLAEAEALLARAKARESEMEASNNALRAEVATLTLNKVEQDETEQLVTNRMAFGLNRKSAEAVIKRQRHYHKLNPEKYPAPMLYTKDRKRVSVSIPAVIAA